MLAGGTNHFISSAFQCLRISTPSVFGCPSSPSFPLNLLHSSRCTRSEGSIVSSGARLSERPRTVFAHAAKGLGDGPGNGDHTRALRHTRERNRDDRSRAERVNSHIAPKSPTTQRLPFAHGHDVTSKALNKSTRRSERT